jgi:hypothetical protein
VFRENREQVWKRLASNIWVLASILVMLVIVWLVSGGDSTRLPGPDGTTALVDVVRPLTVAVNRLADARSQSPDKSAPPMIAPPPPFISSSAVVLVDCLG